MDAVGTASFGHLTELGFKSVAETAPRAVQENSLVALLQTHNLASFRRRDTLHIPESNKVALSRGELVDGHSNRLRQGFGSHSVVDLLHPRDRRVGPRTLLVETRSVHRELWILDGQRPVLNQASRPGPV